MEHRLTEDGSSTLFSKEVGDTYHSKFGALSESQFIFIQEGFQQVQCEHVQILEVGLGTGLNCLLTILATKERSVDYTALEPFPLDQAILHWRIA